MGYNTDAYVRKKYQTKKQQEREWKLTGRTGTKARRKTGKSDGLNKMK